MEHRVAVCHYLLDTVQIRPDLKAVAPGMDAKQQIKLKEADF